MLLELWLWGLGVAGFGLLAYIGDDGRAIYTHHFALNGYSILGLAWSARAWLSISTQCYVSSRGRRGRGGVVQRCW